jgi:tRNA pseudouridine55 synthase
LDDKSGQEKSAEVFQLLLLCCWFDCNILFALSENLNKPFGLTLLVDKPLEWTSFDVVNKLRSAVKQHTGKKKNKVGHAGTLDPLATGLVIICIGKHTKTIESLMGLDKTYTGTIRLGGTTPSYDLETEIDETFPIPELNSNQIKSVAKSFIGPQEQLPPIFSAKKIDGRKAYELARKGREVTMKPSQISIESLELDASNYPGIDFELTCSKGTYVRSLAFDFGKKMGSGAHLTSLRRTRIGNYSIEDSFDIEGAIKHIEDEYIKYLELNSD